VSKKSSRKVGRVVKYTRADGTQVEKRYAPWQPKPVANTGTTLGDLLAAWQRSPRWRNTLKQRSQETYGRAMRPLAPFARVEAKDLTRRDLLDLRDAILEARGPGAARTFVTAVGSLWNWALDYDWNVQPGATRRLLEDLPSGELPAWSRVEADLACQHLPERLRRAVVLGMHTGQRRGDLIAMRWSDYDGAAIHIVQEKTGTELVIPVVPELKAELDAWKPSVMNMSGKTAGTILLTDASERWNETNLSTQMSRYLDKVPGFPSGRNIHGLRKLVAASLAAAGCSVHEIMSITGHKTLAMVALYTKSMDQERTAEAAVAKLTEQRAKTALNLSPTKSLQKR
jgi:integrase